MTVEVAKAFQGVVTGTTELTVSKVTAYFVVSPGESEGEASRQVHVYAQKIVRD